MKLVSLTKKFGHKSRTARAFQNQTRTIIKRFWNEKTIEIFSTIGDGNSHPCRFSLVYLASFSSFANPVIKFTQKVQNFFAFAPDTNFLSPSDAHRKRLKATEHEPVSDLEAFPATLTVIRSIPAKSATLNQTNLTQNIIRKHQNRVILSHRNFSRDGLQIVLLLLVKILPPILRSHK